MRFRGVFILGLLCLLPAPGCEQRPSNNELGTVVFTLPDVPGADKLPSTPELDALEVSRSSSSSESSGSSPAPRLGSRRPPKNSSAAPPPGSPSGGRVGT